MTVCVIVAVTVWVLVDAGAVVVTVLPGAVTVRDLASWVTVTVLVDGAPEPVAVLTAFAAPVEDVAALAAETGPLMTLRTRETWPPLAIIPSSTPTIRQAIAPEAPRARW